MVDVAGRFRLWLMNALIRRGAWPVPMRSLEQFRNMASYALGAGSANLPLEQTGELKLLESLAERWLGRQDVVVVDVGANVGGYAAAVRRAFGRHAQIHCFEPDPVSFDALRTRFAQDENTHCHQQALSADHGSAQLYTNRGGSPLGSLHRETFELISDAPALTYEVNVETLDRMCRQLELDRIDLLKVDVEGHELAVLSGAQALLDTGAIAAVQFEFGSRNRASRSFLRDFVNLLGADHQLYRVTPRGLTPLEYEPSSEMFLEETNYAAIRRT